MEELSFDWRKVLEWEEEEFVKHVVIVVVSDRDGRVFESWRDFWSSQSDLLQNFAHAYPMQIPGELSQIWHWHFLHTSNW